MSHRVLCLDVGDLHSTVERPGPAADPKVPVALAVRNEVAGVGPTQILGTHGGVVQRQGLRLIVVPQPKTGQRGSGYGHRHRSDLGEQVGW